MNPFFINRHRELRSSIELIKPAIANGVTQRVTSAIKLAIALTVAIATVLALPAALPSPAHHAQGQSQSISTMDSPPYQIGTIDVAE